MNLFSLVGYSDSDHAGDLVDRKSTSGYIFILNGCTIHWRSTEQNMVALSSTQAEYIGMSGRDKKLYGLEQS